MRCLIDAPAPRISVLKPALPCQCQRAPDSLQFHLVHGCPAASPQLPRTLARSRLLATCKCFTTAVSSILWTAGAHCGCVQTAVVLIKAKNKTRFIYSFLNSTAFVFWWGKKYQMPMRKRELFTQASGTLFWVGKRDK